jgi:hypothetical protein
MCCARTRAPTSEVVVARHHVVFQFSDEFFLFEVFVSFILSLCGVLLGQLRVLFKIFLLIALLLCSSISYRDHPFGVLSPVQFIMRLCFTDITQYSIYKLGASVVVVTML